MKTPKNYRLHPMTCEEIKWLLNNPESRFSEDYTETALIEYAIGALYLEERHNTNENYRFENDEIHNK